ncbi:MAG: hypothetical protein D6744_10185, partial [Planctomycetota bacterium]
MAAVTRRPHGGKDQSRRGNRGRVAKHTEPDSTESLDEASSPLRRATTEKRSHPMTLQRRLWPSALAATLALTTAAAPAQERPRRETRGASQPAAPQVGEPAPIFKLKTLDGKREFELASQRGKRP